MGAELLFIFAYLPINISICHLLYVHLGLGVRGPRCSRASQVRGLCLLCLGVSDTPKMRGDREHRGLYCKITGSKSSVFTNLGVRTIPWNQKTANTGPGPRCNSVYWNTFENLVHMENDGMMHNIVMNCLKIMQNIYYIITVKISLNWHNFYI